MRYAVMMLAALLALPCFAIEESITVDTLHPRASLAPLSGIQGMSKDLRVFVRADSRPYSLSTNSSVVLYYATNLTSMTVGTVASTSIDTNTESALIQTVPLPPGNFQYALALVESGRTNDLGTGLLIVKASTFGGAFSPIPGQTIDWSTLLWTGSNQPVKSGSATINGLPITNGATFTISSTESDPYSLHTNGDNSATTVLPLLGMSISTNAGANTNILIVSGMLNDQNGTYILTGNSFVLQNPVSFPASIYWNPVYGGGAYALEIDGGGDAFVQTVGEGPTGQWPTLGAPFVAYGDQVVTNTAQSISTLARAACKTTGFTMGGNINMDGNDITYIGRLIGYQNSGSGSSAIALGMGASCNNLNSFVWSDGTPTSTDDSYQFKVAAQGGIYLNGPIKLTLPLPSSAGVAGTLYTNATGALMVSP
ncbi:MAG: hypothetical protein WC736_15300 [Gallionella sp.]|jgi:hypothetical protein